MPFGFTINVMEPVENSPSVRAAAAVLAAIAGLALLPAFSALFFGVIFIITGWFNLLYGIALVIAAAFNFVWSLDVLRNRKSGKALIPVLVISMAIVFAHLLLLVLL